MSIRPLDMQVMVPKLNEVAQMKHLEHQKAGLNQQEIGHAFDKKNEKAQSSVEKTQEEDLLQNHTDAKEQGKNTYNPKNMKKNDKNSADNKPNDNSSGHKIDIKI